MTRSVTYDLFVSYVDADQAWVEGYLLDALQAAGLGCHSEAAFALGVPRVLEFERAVQQSRRTLLVLSPAYLADGFTRFADLLAQSYGLATSSWPVIPLVLQPVTLPARLALLTALDATDPARWPAAVASLCAELDRAVPEPPPKPGCPYPGMVPFRPEDARFFHGREAEIEQMLQHLRQQQLLFVIGPSGSGKSSLVRAGVLPRLPRTSYFREGYWLVREMRPGAQPLGALAQAIAGSPEQPEISVADLLAVHPPSQRLLLVVDQFEELFTQAESGEQTAFFSALRAIRATGRCTLVATMRADFYPDLMNSELWPVDPAQRIEIAPLRGPALRQAIEQPAAEVGVWVEATLVERLLADAAEEPGVLALVQETMVLLWDKMARRLLPLVAYEQLGGEGRSGLAVAVARKADATIAELTPPQQQIARRTFLRLVQLSEGGRDTRRQRPLVDLRSPGDDPDDFGRALEHLTRNRLVTRSGDDDSHGPLVDLSHEALISGWPRFRAWIEEDRAGLLLYQRLAQQSKDWVRHGRDESFLYGGSRLLEVQRYTAQNIWDLNQDEVEFLAASEVREAARKRSRYLGQAAGGAVGAALGYSLAFALGFWSTHSGFERQTGTPLTFLFMFPVGQLIGFTIGLGLWLWRSDPARRVVATGFLGALASSATYALFLLLALQVPIDGRHVAAGALFGAGLGLGAGLPHVRWQRLLGTTVGGVLASGLALTIGGVSWSPLITVISGCLLGSLTGLGLQATAVEDDDSVVV